MKLLLHTCCAPCSIQCVEELAAENIVPVLFWYNPNIHPYTEYRSRRDALRVFAEDRKLSLIEEDEYGLRSFIKSVEGCAEDGRCAYCYRLRLEKTAAFAKEKAYDGFSTTLLISPYQKHNLIRKTGEDMASRYGLQFF